METFRQKRKFVQRGLDKKVLTEEELLRREWKAQLRKRSKREWSAPEFYKFDNKVTHKRRFRTANKRLLNGGQYDSCLNKMTRERSIPR
jgi:hypothetical protein